MHSITKYLYSHNLPLILVVPAMGWLAIVAHWSETPMLAPLLFVAMFVVVAGYVWQNNWLRTGGAVCSTIVMGMITQEIAPPLIWPQVVSWLACIAAVLIPYLPALWRRLRARARTVRANVDWYGAVGAVTLLAIGVRAWQLDSIPIPISDESAAALYSIEILHRSFTNPFISGWYGFPSLWFFLTTPFLNTLGTTFFAIRLLPMLLGSLCIPVLIWAVRPVLSRQTALLSGVTLALLGIHIHFSRYGLNNIVDSVTSIVLFGLIVRYRNRPTVNMATAIGLTIGAALYGYVSARVFPLIVLLSITAEVARDRSTWRIHLSNLMVIAVTSFVVAAPLMVHYIEQPHEFWKIVERNSTMKSEADGLTVLERWGNEHNQSVAEVVVRNVLYTMQAIFWGPMEGWFESKRALLTPPFAILALLGIVRAWTRRLDNTHIAVGVWLVVFCSISAVMWPVAAGQRMVALLGVLAFLIGSGAELILTHFPRRFNQRFIIVFLWLLVAAGGGMSVEHYFNTFVMREAGTGDPQLHRAGIVALIAERLPEHTQIDVYRSDTFNYDTAPVLRFALMRLNVALVDDASHHHSIAPIIVCPVEALERLILDDQYLTHTVYSPTSELTLVIATRVDAPWAAAVVRTVLQITESQ